MHLQVSIALLFILLTGGFSLNCYDCQYQKGGPCTQIKKCNKCASTKTVGYYGQYRNLTMERIGNSTRLKRNQVICDRAVTKKETFSKSCVMPRQCTSWSFSTGCWRKEYSAQCCNTNLCNKQDAPVLISHKPNGKRCFTCDRKACSKTVSCWGNEYYCFTANATYQTIPIKGCASKSACDQEQGQILGPGVNVTCCVGNLCNGAQSVSQSFLFLCCSLLSYFLLN